MVKLFFVAGVAIVAWVLLLGFFTGIADAGGHTRCGTVQEVLDYHKKTYGQTVISTAPTSIENISLTVLATPNGTLWVIIMTNSKTGRSCFKVDGTNWPVER